MDRLITELKLPPADAYHKIAFTIEEVNAVIRAAGGGTASTPANGSNGSSSSTPLLDPVKGNVAFASAMYGYSFTLRSFAALYKAVCGDDPKDVLIIDSFAQRLWGDVWYYPEERVFRKKPPQLGEEGGAEGGTAKCAGGKRSATAGSGGRACREVAASGERREGVHVTECTGCATCRHLGASRHL